MAKRLQGFCTLKEIAAYYEVSTVTMRKKIQPLKLFMDMTGGIKRTYSPDEIEMIISKYGKIV